MYGNILRHGIYSGILKGWRGFLWMMKIIIPISFFTVLLSSSGVLEGLDSILGPLMGFLKLPSFAALPLIVGMLTGIYGAVAVMAVLPFSIEEMTLLAIFLLIAHNLIQEGIIQGKSGINPLTATLFRIAIAVFTVLVVSLFIEIPSVDRAGTSIAREGNLFSLKIFNDWALAIAPLAGKIFLIIMTIMILLETLKLLGWIPAIVSFLAPILRIMGLSRHVGLLWVTAVVFGLAYGGAVIVEESRSGQINQMDLKALQLSIGINHSMLEDPFLFLPLGIGAFWLWVPRLIVAVIVVRIFTACGAVKKRLN